MYNSEVKRRVANVLLDEGMRIMNACHVEFYEDLEFLTDSVGEYASELFSLWLDQLEG